MLKHFINLRHDHLRFLVYVFADKTVIKDSTNTVGRRAGGIEEESTSKMDAKMCFAIFKVIHLFNISLTLIVCYFHICRIYPKYSDTLNIRTPSFFLKRHLFYVPYISGHVPYWVFLLSVNVRTPKTCPLFLKKLLFFAT